MENVAVGLSEKKFVRFIKKKKFHFLVMFGSRATVGSKNIKNNKTVNKPANLKLTLYKLKYLK